MRILKVTAIDALITSSIDELFDLQEKYNVKISRSNSSDAVYIFRNRRQDTVRVGHPISKADKKWHLKNFAVSVEVPKVTREIVENAIKQHFK